MDAIQVARMLFDRQVGSSITLPHAEFFSLAFDRGDPKFPARLASLIAEMSYQGKAIYAVVVTTYTEGDYYSATAEAVAKVTSNEALDAWLEYADASYENDGFDYGWYMAYYAAPSDLL